MSHSISQNFNGRTLLKFAFPTIIMMVFMSMYTMVDGFFVSRFVGADALSAINIVYPLIGLVVGMGIMLGTGGSAVIARQLGLGQAQEARKNGDQILVARMNKNKKFQKEQLTKEGYTDFVEFYKNPIEKQ